MRSRRITAIVLAAVIVYAMAELVKLHSELNCAIAVSQSLQTEIAAAVSENERLSYDLQNARSDGNMREAAKDKLGLADGGDIIFLFEK